MSSKVKEALNQLTPEEYAERIKRKYGGTSLGKFVLKYLEKYVISENDKNNGGDQNDRLH